jgi:hypothetical protein
MMRALNTHKKQIKKKKKNFQLGTSISKQLNKSSILVSLLHINKPFLKTKPNFINTEHTQNKLSKKDQNLALKRPRLSIGCER